MPQQSYLISTVVWGEDFIRLFDEITLPSLLANHNIPALAGTGTEYLVHVDLPGLERLQASPVVRELGRYITFRFEPITPELHRQYPNKYVQMTRCHKDAIARGAALDAPLIFVNPDQVLSDGTIARIMERTADGKRAVMVAGLRLRRETAAPALLDLRDPDGALALSPRDLTGLLGDHLHRWARAMHWDSPEFFHQNPTHLYFGDPRTGLVARCWHLHPLMVYPDRERYSFAGTVDGDFLSAACADESRIHVVTESDELVIYDLTEENRYEDLIAPAVATPENATEVVARNLTPLHFSYFGQRIHFRVDDRDLSDVDRYSDTIAAQVAEAARQRISTQE